MLESLTDKAALRILLIILTVLVSVICKLSFDIVDVDKFEEVEIKAEMLLYPALENFLPLITVFIFHSNCLKRCKAT